MAQDDNVDAGNRQTQANFECAKCNTKTNADVIGGKNIRCRGVATTAKAENLACWPDSVNRRTRMGKNQRTQALQRPLLLFTKREPSLAILLLTGNDRRSSIR